MSLRSSINDNIFSSSIRSCDASEIVFVKLTTKAKDRMRAFILNHLFLVQIFAEEHAKGNQNRPFRSSYCGALGGAFF
jgi:hypothetical protein